MDAAGRPSFVLHEHRRPRLHWDLRLEEGGVLRSWALPRGVPEHPGQRRLAVAVADHDLDHLPYEDEDKDVADTGWWREVSRDDRRLVLELHGRGDPRRYALVRSGKNGKDWLLLLTREQPPGSR